MKISSHTTRNSPLFSSKKINQLINHNLYSLNGKSPFLGMEKSGLIRANESSSSKRLANSLLSIGTFQIIDFSRSDAYGDVEMRKLVACFFLPPKALPTLLLCKRERKKTIIRITFHYSAKNSSTLSPTVFMVVNH